MPKHTNKLIDSTSPYLLQHAHNPVDWHPWGDEALDKAKKENKPILVSIGYSACHWCHVMERESFEDETTAEIMNAYFVCIKVDREERPDIDQLYMLAVQLMSNQGGWPLNCFTLPDGRPIYGGTYFPKDNWQNILQQVHKLYQEEYEKVLEYAENLTQGIKQSELFKQKQGSELITSDDLHKSVNNWLEIVDQEEGGPNRAPKFPLPNNYQFLLKYSEVYDRKHVMAYTHLTLKKMAFGGIFDQIGGGFARYSTDIFWKAPHFEKMLYDNGQLLSLYAEAYLQRDDEDYRNVCIKTVNFLKNELRHEKGYFFSALDADSEGVEGKFYVWSKKELQEVLTDEEYKVAEVYYSINKFGLWEDDNYILLRREEDEVVAEILNISITSLNNTVNKIDAKLLEKRNSRIRPGLDDKMLCSWNAMMIRGLSDAGKVFEDEEMIQLAKQAAAFILLNLKDETGKIQHSYKNGKSSIDGFLEDYAFLIDALIALFETTYDEKWLIEARELMFTTLSDFDKSESGLFNFTSNLTKTWVARQIETSDNVQPASNSMMARNLYKLGLYFGRSEWMNQSRNMIKTVRDEFIKYGPGYSNWGMLAIEQSENYNELVIVGKGAFEQAKRLSKSYKPNYLIVASESKKSSIEIFKDRYKEGETLYYLCKGNACERPSTEFNWI